MATFPLPTLAPTIDANGISIPAFEDIVSSLQVIMQQIYGSDILLTPDTQDGQFIAAWAKTINDENMAMVAVYNNQSPATAQGAGLSSNVKINGLTRKVATNSIATLTCVGQAGTQIVNGQAKDQDDNLWQLPPLVTIPAAGGIDVTATAVEQGDISAPANSINIIATPTLGWQTVNNANDAEVGDAIETDGQLRIRQTQSTSLPAQTPLQSILAAVANLQDVRRSAIYENSTDTPDANGIPGHSIALVVDGGDPTEVAQVIQTKKAPGTGTFGTQSVTVQDPSGLSLTINFFGLVGVPIFVTVTIRPLPGFTTATQDQIAQAIVDFINSIPIGDSVFFNWLFAPASLNGNMTFRVLTITVGTDPSAEGTADVFIGFNQAATCSLANVVVQTG